jgi:ADP-heptose:LPS heptosyltransferase
VHRSPRHPPLRHLRPHDGQLAVAVGAPTVAVFGPSDDTRVGPWGGVSIRGERSFDEFRAVDPNLNQAIQHMMGLPADRVLKAARTLLEKNRAAQSGAG